MVFEFSVLKNYFNIGDFIPYFSFFTITETIQQSDWDGSHLRDKVTLMLILGCVVSVCEHKYIYIFFKLFMFFYLCLKTMILFLLYYYIFIILLLSYSQPMGRAGGLFFFLIIKSGS